MKHTLGSTLKLISDIGESILGIREGLERLSIADITPKLLKRLTRIKADIDAIGFTGKKSSSKRGGKKWSAARKAAFSKAVKARLAKKKREASKPKKTKLRVIVGGRKKAVKPKKKRNTRVPAPGQIKKPVAA